MNPIKHHRTLYQVFKRAAVLWYNSDADRSAAAVSYWAVFSFAPLLVLITLLATMVYGNDYVVSIFASWGTLLGDNLITLLLIAAKNILNAGVPIFGPIFFFMVTIIGINEFTNGLHSLWDIEHDGMRGFIRKSFYSTFFILFLSFLTFFALATHSPFTILEYLFEGQNPMIYTLVVASHTLLTILLLTALFTASFMLLPFKRYSFRHSLFGGFIAAVLFSFGKIFIAIYTNITPIPELYGTAGVLILLLIWIFFSSAVIYYGAAVTRAHAELCAKNNI